MFVLLVPEEEDYSDELHLGSIDTVRQYPSLARSDFFKAKRDKQQQVVTTCMIHDIFPVWAFLSDETLDGQSPPTRSGHIQALQFEVSEMISLVM